MLNFGRIFVALACISGASIANAEGPPLGGQVFNLELNQRVHYSWRSLTETELECDFTEATVSQVLPADKVAERRAADLKQLELPGAIEEFWGGKLWSC